MRSQKIIEASESTPYPVFLIFDTGVLVRVKKC